MNPDIYLDYSRDYAQYQKSKWNEHLRSVVYSHQFSKNIKIYAIMMQTWLRRDANMYVVEIDDTYRIVNEQNMKIEYYHQDEWIKELQLSFDDLISLANQSRIHYSDTICSMIGRELICRSGCSKDKLTADSRYCSLD